MTRKLYPAMLTPLTEGGDALDEAAFRPMVDFLLDRGCDGLFVCGTTGEGINLSLDERRQALRFTRDALEGRADLLVHCGAQNTRDTEALAADASELGVAGVAVIPPPYYPLDEPALTGHLVAAAEACAPTPFFIYCFAARSGYPVPTTVVERVRQRVSNLAGLKVSEARFEDVAPYLHMGLPVFIGNEPLIAEACAAGEVAGAVSALASVYPEAVRALLDEPTPERAASVKELRDAISHQAVPASAKALLGRRGVPIRPDVRRPLRALDPAQAEAAERRAAEPAGAAVA
jgi:dihydrodipicolinate synthase/N-acetylneuraminate lyase